eukprot:CAMPEP_0197021576 /NCGR_PEP_ID=MMETSP1384-20130603/2492_1 /TAXON_ID=29189 /ORGANISM="Ammonia sp." /LENGTH=319 /DNA_ID=CAMNT_0042449433 /DNA_START=74 /DNA_END=1033 /DNA_ORIENTATION=+
MANLQEMQRRLRQLADSHKKAKLLQIFSKQDELRPFTTNENQNTQNLSSKAQEIEATIQAMQMQFDNLSKLQLEKQLDKQFLLRLNSSDEIGENGERKQNLYGYGSDGSGDQKIDSEDMEAMKAEFDKYQKLLLNTQIEKSFRLRAPSKSVEAKHSAKIIESREDTAEIEVDPDDEMDVEKQKELEEEYNAMNKMMLSYRSSKWVESNFAPQIKPQHRERFNILCRDIGIVNEHIVTGLWQNIEDTVHQEVEDEVVNDQMGNELEDGQQRDARIAKLQSENRVLQQKLQFMQQKLAALQQQQRDEDDLEFEGDDDDDQR